MKTADKGRTAGGAMYFGPRKDEGDLSQAIDSLINGALEMESETSPPRGKGPRLGPSLVGGDCRRRIAYDWCEIQQEFRSFKSNPEGWRRRKKFDGAILRRFALGNWYEEEVARWLRLAGFDLSTHTTGGDGREWQHSFWVCRDENTGVTRFGGFTDGLIRHGPLTDIPYPVIWENKIMNVKKWADFQKRGIKKANLGYYRQVNLYMAYSPIIFKEQIDNTLFTAVNTDTSEIHAEVVPFDVKAAQDVSDTVVKVLDAEAPEVFPRVSDDPERFPCGWCDHRDVCHGLSQKVTTYGA